MTDDAVLETIITAGKLDTTIDILRSLVDEAVLQIGKDGITTSVVEPGNVCGYPTLRLGSAAFESTPSGSFALGINLERLQDTIKRADSGTPVSLGFNPETRKLRVQYDRVDASLACIDPDSIRDQPDSPDLELPNHFSINVGDLEAAAEQVDIVAERFDIDVVPGEGVTFVGKGDVDDQKYHVPTADLQQSDLGGDTFAMFSMEFINSLFGAIPSGVDTIAVHVGDEFPLLIDYEYAGGDGRVEGMLAPRIGKKGK